MSIPINAITINAITINMNNTPMIMRNILLKHYLRIKGPVNRRLNKCKDRLITLYYELPLNYYSLLEDEKLILETIFSLL
jgi:hypothetical protein